MNEALTRALRLHQEGQLDKAHDAYISLLETSPQNADLTHLLGLVIFQQGDPGAALERVSRAAELRPDDPVIRNNLGEVLRALGREEEATKQYRKALALQPDYPEPHNNLAVILTLKGRFADARVHCEAALALRPDYADAWYNQGLSWQGEGNWVEAARCYERCIDLGAAFADVFNNLALCRQQQDDWAAAETFYRRALELDPSFLPALNNLAELCERSGRLDEALAYNQHALDAAPDDPHGGLISARLCVRKGDLPDAVQQLRGLANRRLSNTLDQAVQFELGQALDRTGDYAGAFAAFTRANRAQSTDPRYPGVRPQRFLERLAGYRDQLDLLCWENAEPAADAPVFLVGFPRSGTTLLDQILDAHPGVQVITERPCLEALQETLESGYTAYPLALNDLSEAQRRDLRALYYRTADRFVERQTGLVLADKYPFNITRLPLIHRVFPGAKIILSLRHPCDVVLSCFMQQFTPNDAMANFHSLESGATAYACVMDLWESSVKHFEIDAHTLRYEDLVSNFEDSIGNCLKYLGVAWTDSVSNFCKHAARRGRINTPSYRQVTQPLYSSSVDRWKNYCGKFEKAAPVLEPWIKHYGYSTD